MTAHFRAVCKAAGGFPHGVQRVGFSLLWIATITLWAQVPERAELLVHEQDMLAQKAEVRDHSAIERWGTDPVAITRLAAINRVLVLLKNRSQLLLCDDELQVLGQLPTPKQPIAWHVTEDGFIFVGGTLESRVSLYAAKRDGLKLLGSVPVEGAKTIRDLFFIPSFRHLFILDDFEGRLFLMRFEENWSAGDLKTGITANYPVGPGAISLAQAEGLLVVNALFQQRLRIFPLVDGKPDFTHETQIKSDGGFWSTALFRQGNQLWIAAGGIENHPLERTGGGFGFVDSFLYLFRLEMDPASHRFQWQETYRNQPETYREVNLSALGVVTPKALQISESKDGQLQLWVAGFGTRKVLRFNFSKATLDLRPQTGFEAMFGISDFTVTQQPGGETVLFGTSTLTDQAGKFNASGKVLAQWPATPGVGRDSRTHLGEYLLFTTLMAPHNRSEGGLSRFTCEACHFEGTLDGRIHYTGRDNVYATPKTLRGLAQNIPFFSSGGDDSLAKMVLAEFRVANQDQRGDFSLDRSQVPELEALNDLPQTLSPTDLRLGLMAFFAAYDHPPNPMTYQNGGLSPKARRGLGVFRNRCENCHQGVSTTRNESGVPFEQWEHWIIDPNKDLIWGAPFYSKTGITPYFDPGGTSVPSLRRIWQKFPLFTNGSAETLDQVLDAFRYQGTKAWHRFTQAENPDYHQVQALEAWEKEALEQLLRHF